MSRYIAIAVFLLASVTMYGQDATAILTKARQKCQSVQNGYYEMTKHMLPMTRKDTIRTSFTCHFKKLANDTVCSSAYHSRRFWGGRLTHDILYTGDDYVVTNPRDSSAAIMTKSLWSEEIIYSTRSDERYRPLTNSDSWPLPEASNYIDGRHTFKLIGTENVGSISCYRIQIGETPKNDSTDMMKHLRTEYHIWVNKDDYIPVQFSTAYDAVMNNDTMHQYELFRLDKYELNNLKNMDVLSLNSIPSYAKVKDFVPYEEPEPLAINSSAPDWELNSLEGTKVSLQSMRGQVVLVDFFYKSCFGCMLALPVLQTLHEKYKDRGLVVVGIDPYDTKEDIAPFLAKRGATYTVLLGGMDIAKKYRVSGYPNLFLIDKQGRIIDIHGGFTKSMEGRLEEMIIKSL